MSEVRTAYIQTIMDYLQDKIENIKNDIESDSIDEITKNETLCSEITDTLTDIYSAVIEIQTYDAYDFVILWLDFIKDLMCKSDQIRNYLYTNVSQQLYLDITAENSVPVWCKKVYMEFIVQNDTPTVPTLQKLFKVIRRGSNFESQKTLFNVIIEHCEQHDIFQAFKKFVKDNNEMKRLLEDVFMEKDRHLAIRTLLNKMNFHNHRFQIYSIKALEIRMENFLLTRNVWINFNTPSKTVSFECPKICLSLRENIESSHQDCFEIIIVKVSSVSTFKFESTYLEEYFEGCKLILALQEPCTAIYKSSVQFLEKYKEITFYFKNNLKHAEEFICKFFAANENTAEFADSPPTSQQSDEPHDLIVDLTSPKCYSNELEQNENEEAPEEVLDEDYVICSSVNNSPSQKNSGQNIVDEGSPTSTDSISIRSPTQIINTQSTIYVKSIDRNQCRSVPATPENYLIDRGQNRSVLATPEDRSINRSQNRSVLATPEDYSIDRGQNSGILATLENHSIDRGQNRSVLATPEDHSLDRGQKRNISATPEDSEIEQNSPLSSEIQKNIIISQSPQVVAETPIVSARTPQKSNISDEKEVNVSIVCSTPQKSDILEEIRTQTSVTSQKSNHISKVETQTASVRASQNSINTSEEIRTSKVYAETPQKSNNTLKETVCYETPQKKNNILEQVIDLSNISPIETNKKSHREKLVSQDIIKSNLLITNNVENLRKKSQSIRSKLPIIKDVDNSSKAVKKEFIKPLPDGSFLKKGRKRIRRTSIDSLEYDESSFFSDAETSAKVTSTRTRVIKKPNFYQYCTDVETSPRRKRQKRKVNKTFSSPVVEEFKIPPAKRMKTDSIEDISASAAIRKKLLAAGDSGIHNGDITNNIFEKKEIFNGISKSQVRNKRLVRKNVNLADHLEEEQPNRIFRLSVEGGSRPNVTISQNITNFESISNRINHQNTFEINFQNYQSCSKNAVTNNQEDEEEKVNGIFGAANTSNYMEQSDKRLDSFQHQKTAAENIPNQTYSEDPHSNKKEAEVVPRKYVRKNTSIFGQKSTEDLETSRENLFQPQKAASKKISNKNYSKDRLNHQNEAEVVPEKQKSTEDLETSREILFQRRKTASKKIPNQTYSEDPHNNQNEAEAVPGKFVQKNSSIFEQKPTKNLETSTERVFRPRNAVKEVPIQKSPPQKLGENASSEDSNPGIDEVSKKIKSAMDKFGVQLIIPNSQKSLLNREDTEDNPQFLVTVQMNSPNRRNFEIVEKVDKPKKVAKKSKASCSKKVIRVPVKRENKKKSREQEDDVVNDLLPTALHGSCDNCAEYRHTVSLQMKNIIKQLCQLCISTSDENSRTEFFSDMEIFLRRAKER